VETEEELSFLRFHSCHQVQGFYYSKPRNREDITKLLKDGGFMVRDI